MATREILNLGQTFAGRSPQDEPAPASDEAGQARELVDQARFDVGRMRRQLDRQQDEYEGQSRRTKILSMILGVLTITFAGAVWLAYPTWKSQNTALAEMLGVRNLANTLGERMSSVESNLDKVSAGLPVLADRFDQLQANMKAGMQTAGNQAQAIATEAGRRLREELSRSVQMIQSRLAAVESNQREASERVTLLQQQVAGLQQEIAALRQTAAASGTRIEEVHAAQQTSNQQLAGLSARMNANQGELNTLANRLDRKRIDFETPVRRYTEIAPDIFIMLERVDVGKQEFDATLHLGTRPGKRLAIHTQTIQKPVIFYVQDESRPYELVLTLISKSEVSGYLMMPAVPTQPR